MKCVTGEGDIVFQTEYPKSDSPPLLNSDDGGNVFVCDQSLHTVCVIKEDGTERCLIRAGDSKFCKLNTLCYNMMTTGACIKPVL